ncbi:MAG: hypothetical protein RBT63_07360 [Bdellovibrionales bacterium]|jgi:hypothetical protein|nr:hypothetical protein [Bdellovibrionales bacterium]
MERDKSSFSEALQQVESGLTETDYLTPAQEFLLDQTTCCLCGTELLLTHKIDHLNLNATEDAECESCKISLRSRTHSLQ